MSSKRDSADPNPTAQLTVPDFEAPESWATLGERYLYRPGPPGEDKPGFAKNRVGEVKAHCGSVPIKGYIIDSEFREDKSGNGQDYSQLAICLTGPCIGIDGEVHKQLEAGNVIVVTETAALNVLQPVAKHPTHTAEVYLKPGGMKPIPGRPGQAMRLWTRKVNPQVLQRSALPLPTLSAFKPDESGLPRELRGDVTKPLPQNAGASS